jgi:hypothetical protein
MIFPEDEKPSHQGDASARNSELRIIVKDTNIRLIMSKTETKYQVPFHQQV